jgi:thiopeptide-type bacteriocin biosynthesis protein
LRRVGAPLVRDLVAGGVVDDWHVLRYDDPAPHLRLRLHGDPGRLAAEALPALHRALAGAGADPPWRLTLDTYVRELERYGGPETIEHVERAFTADSEAVCALLALTPAPNRFTAAVALVLDTLAAVAGGRDEPLAALAGLRDELGRRAGWTGDDHRRLGREHRQHRAALDAVVHEPPAPLREVLERRHGALRDAGAALGDLHRAGRAPVPRQAGAASLAHLTVNRLLVHATPWDEAWIHEMALRTGRSRIARGEPLVPWW